MLLILLDMFVLWLLLNIFSDENWEDEKFKILMMVLAISVLGGLAVNALVESIGLSALAVYFGLGFLVFWAIGNLPYPKAAIAMGIFLAYKVVQTLLLVAVFA